MGPPNRPVLAHAAGAARPAVQVRDQDGALLPQISAADASVLCSRGWAHWSGQGARRHLTLTDAAPLHRLPGGSHAGTRRDRADQTCRVYATGQAFGRHHLVEFTSTTR